MDNNADNGQPQDGLVIPPQDFLNFLGHLSHGAVIGAVTSGALKDNVTNLLKALEAGDLEKAKAEADSLRQGINLVGTVVCKLGKELASHDEMVFRHCRQNGVKVESKAQGLIKRMHDDVAVFVEEFLEDADTHRFTDTPPEPTDKPKPKGKPPTSGRFPEGFDFGGQSKDN